MVAVGSLIEEGVEKVEDVAIIAIVFLFVGLILLEGFDPLWMIGVAGHFLQYFDLSCLPSKIPHRRTPPGSAVRIS